MKRSQWFVLGIGFILLGSLLIRLGLGACLVEDTSLFVGCMIRRYAYGIPAIFSYALGVLFLICGWLERKNETAF